MYKSLIAISLLFIGCTASTAGNSKNDKHQTEMAIHKNRTDLEELKCELNSTQSQLQILTNKLENQETTLANLKQETITAQQVKLDELGGSLALVEKQLKQATKLQKDTIGECKELASQAGDTKKALQQHKNKIAEVEHQLASQKKELDDIVKMRQIIDELSELALQLSQKSKGDGS